MTTERTSGRIEPERFAEAPPVLAPDEGAPIDGATNWPVLVLPADPGVERAATPGSAVAAAALEHETAFLERKKRQLDLAPHLTPDVPEARVAGIVSWSDLTDEVLLTILANTGLMKGLRVDPERLVLEPAARAALTVEAGALREAVNLCREDYFTHRACDGEVETALATSSVVKGSASASYAFASAKVAASKRERATRTEGHRAVTAVGRQLSRRAVVFLGRDRARPTPEFLAAVTAALARPDLVAQAQALSEVFDAFGLIWAQEVGLGSARTVATDVQVSETATSSEVERHISAAVNVKFGGASGRATAEAGQDTNADAHVRNEVAEASSATQGDVESPLHWAVIARDRLTPVYELLPEDLRDRVLEVLFRARPELVEPVFAGPGAGAGTTTLPVPPHGEVPLEAGRDELTAVTTRSHTRLTADALLLVSCDATDAEPGWSQVDVEATGGPRGPVATARLATSRADVDDGHGDGTSRAMAIDALCALRGVPWAAETAPDPPLVIASHSALMPVRWPDTFVLRHRRGVHATDPRTATADVEVIAFRGGDRSHFDAWTEWFPWDPACALAAVSPAGATVTDERRTTAGAPATRVSWIPERSGLLVVTASDPAIDGTSPEDRAAVRLDVLQAPLIASFIHDPCLPTPLSTSVPVVKNLMLTLTIAVDRSRRNAAPPPARQPEDAEDRPSRIGRATVPLRFWFLPIRDTMAHMGAPEPLVVNDRYTAHADGFVTVHVPEGMRGTAAVLVSDGPKDAVVGIPGAGTPAERQRAVSTHVRTATVTAPVRQGEVFRAAVSEETIGPMEDTSRLRDLRDAYMADDTGAPRAAFVPLRLVIPS